MPGEKLDFNGLHDLSYNRRTCLMLRLSRKEEKTCDEKSARKSNGDELG